MDVWRHLSVLLSHTAHQTSPETWPELDLICDEYRSLCLWGSMPGPVLVQEKQVLAPMGLRSAGAGGWGRRTLS